MTSNKKFWLGCGLLLLVAFGFRLFIALRLPNDTPDDGRVYAQIARNVLEQHVYSHESEAPYVPSIIRLPGYPLFLASIYAVAGHYNNTAVRIVQATFDAATCGLIALIAFQWMPDEQRKRTAAVAALLLAAVNPFTSIYVATILTEVLTNFLVILMVLLATLAFKAAGSKNTIVLWLVTGFCAGVAVLFRPDSGLFAAAIGLTIICPIGFGLSSYKLRSHKLTLIGRSIPYAAIFSLAFCLVLVPWTIRNYRVFHFFQPLSPAHGEMPGEFVPRGYLMWLRSWLDDGRYIGPVLWRLDTSRISINSFPESAFDSSAERDRVIALLEKYNHPPGSEANQPVNEQAKQEAQQPTGDESEEEEEEEDSDEEDDPSDVEMTPEIDASFAQLARERIARAPFRYYVWLPLKRAKSLWFDTHSQYYPFEGELLPLEDLDYSIHQHIWLPLFAVLTVGYTLLGILGAALLLLTRDSLARRWVLLAALMVFIRLGFFSTLENPEPRYVVEVFPFLFVLGGIAFGCFRNWRSATQAWHVARIK